MAVSRMRSTRRKLRVLGLAHRWRQQIGFSTCSGGCIRPGLLLLCHGSGIWRHVAMQAPSQQSGRAVASGVQGATSELQQHVLALTRIEAASANAAELAVAAACPTSAAPAASEAAPIAELDQQPAQPEFPQPQVS